MSASILVVEDEIIIADEICGLLSKNGYKVLEPALSYAEAVDRFQTYLPHLVILDIELAGKKSGLDVARQIRIISSNPLLFLTACGDPKTMNQIGVYDPVGCIDKVYYQKELLDKVAEALFSIPTGIEKLLQELTATEKAVLKLISNGNTTAQMAAQLGLSQSTVKNHRHHICKKLKLPARTNSLLNWVIMHKADVDKALSNSQS